MTRNNKGKNKHKKSVKSSQALEKRNITIIFDQEQLIVETNQNDSENVHGGGTCQEKTTEETLDILQWVLHELTPERFNRLMEHVKYLKLNTKERLTGAIELILEKAMSQPGYCATYAKLCKELVRMTMASKSGTSSQFLKLLLHRCQQLLQRDPNEDESFINIQKELDAAQNEDEQQRLESEMEAIETKACHHSHSLIRFIGQLFILKMVKESIIHDCIHKLLTDCFEDSFVCLGKLLPTCGKQLDTGDKLKMDQYFRFLKYTMEQDEVSRKVKLVLRDLIEFRMNNWVSEKPENSPGTIQEIHQEEPLKKESELIRVQKKGQQESHVTADESRPLCDVNEFAPEKTNVQGERQLDLTEELQTLLQQRKTNGQIIDWIRDNLDNTQLSSSLFVRALISAVCRSVVSGCDILKVSCREMLERSGLLKTFLTDEQKQLEALDALQELTDTIEPSQNLMWMFLDIFWDEDIVREAIFFKWERQRSVKEGSGSQFFSRIQAIMEKAF